MSQICRINQGHCILTPYKLSIFGVNNEAVCHQVNYAIHESITTGKGPNA